MRTFSPGPCRSMTCVHFRPNLQITSQVGDIGVSQTADACDLLVPWKKDYKQVRRALYDKGFILKPTPFDCPVARNARWSACPFYQPAPA